MANPLCSQTCPSNSTLGGINVGDLVCIMSGCLNPFWIGYGSLRYQSDGSPSSCLLGKKECSTLFQGRIPVTLELNSTNLDVIAMNITVSGKSSGAPVQYGDLIILTLSSTSSTVMALMPFQPSYSHCYGPPRGYYYVWVDSSEADSSLEYSYNIGSTTKSTSEYVLYGDEILLSIIRIPPEIPTACLNSDAICNAFPCLETMTCGNYLTSSMLLTGNDLCLGEDKIIPYPGSGTPFIFFKAGQASGRYATPFIYCVSSDICLNTVCPANICTNKGLCPGGAQGNCDPTNGWTCTAPVQTETGVIIIIIIVLLGILIGFYFYYRSSTKKQAQQQALEENIFR